MKDKTARSGARTLLLSVLMSAPGPLILGLGLLSGRSSTQIADFVRRTAELLAIILSYIVYRMTNGPDGCDEMRKAVLEKRVNLFTGAMMCLGGGIMLVLALFAGTEDKGNVVPGLIIALMGVIANTAFFAKYTRLNRQEPNAILRIQSRLYGAKALVDTGVTAALLTVALLPGTRAAALVDMLGSAMVAVYLIYCGVRTILESYKKPFA